MVKRRGSLTLLALALSACGARSELLFSGQDSTPPDAVSDVMASDVPPTMACTVAWPACRPVTEAINVSGTDLGQQPDVVWDGRELLVVYDGDRGNTVAGVTLDGTILWREEAGGIQAPRIAWNPVLHAGLVVMDSGVRWLDATGHVTGSFVRVEIPGSQLAGAAVPTAGGFLLLSGALSYSSPPPLFAAALGATPSTSVSLTRVAEAGPRSAPEFVVGADGLGTFAASSVWHSMVAELYRITPAGGVRDPVAFGSRLPASSHVVGAAERDGLVSVLTCSSATSALTVTAVRDYIIGAPSTLDFTSPRSNGGHIVHIGNDLVVAGEQSSQSTGVQLAALRGGTSTGLGTPLIVAPTGSQSPRMTLTPRGVVVVWNQAIGQGSGLSALLRVYDCCTGR